MLSDERYKALLRGDKPQNEMEAKWLKSFKEEESAFLEEMIERDKENLEKKEQAYREYYKLIKETFPKNFFYKNPITDKEYKVFKENCFKIHGMKIELILSNPWLRKLNKIPDRNPSCDDYGYRSFLEEYYFQKEINKKYKIDVSKITLDYEKYKTSKFIKKLKEIEEKYNEK